MVNQKSIPKSDWSKVFDEKQKKIYIPEGSIVEDFTIDLQ